MVFLKNGLFKAKRMDGRKERKENGWILTFEANLVAYI